MILKSFKEFIPRIAPDAWLAENAVVIGEVEIGAGASIWYGAVLRGDVGLIKVGERTSIQDGVILHCTNGRTQCIIGNDVTVGHGAILHGCVVEDRVLVGLGAIVLDEAYVESNVVIAAGAVVTEGMRLESGHLYAGVPAKKIKALSPANEEMIRKGALNYVKYVAHHRQTRVVSREETDY